MPNLNEIFRILICRSEEIQVNMVYAEVGDEDYEVFGAFADATGGGGLFHQTVDGEMTVSDDAGEFESKFSSQENYEICKELERLRAEFEVYDDDGGLIGLSEAGYAFLRNASEDNVGYAEVYSDGASEDFIYDVQDSWNLGYYMD